MIKKNFFKILLSLVLLIMLYGCSNYDYSNWKRVEIPTDTPVKGKIMIPNGWKFISENGIITLIDQENNRIIAKQIYQEWRLNGWQGEIQVDNWNDLEFKSNIKDVDYKNESYYTLTLGNSTGAHIYTFNDGENERLCLLINIYLDLSHPAKDSKTGAEIRSILSRINVQRRNRN